MSGGVVVGTERGLAELAAEINRKHQLCEGALRRGLDHALNVGRLLIEAKGRVGHGEWGIWLGKNVVFSARSSGYPNSGPSAIFIIHGIQNRSLGIQSRTHRGIPTN